MLKCSKDFKMLTFWFFIHHAFLAEFRRSEKSWITVCILNRACGVVYNLLIKARGKSLSCISLFFSTFLHIAGINSQIAISESLCHSFFFQSLYCVYPWCHVWVINQHLRKVGGVGVYACMHMCVCLLSEYVHMHKYLRICMRDTTVGYYHISVCLSSRRGCLNVSSNH